MFAKEIAPALEDDGIRFVDWDDLADGDRAYLDTMFAERIFPVLTPLAVDPRTRSRTSPTCRSTWRSPCATA